MHLVLSLLQLSLVHILMAMIPGPNTVAVSYFSASTSRQAGLKAAFGVALGSAIWVSLSLMGVGVLLLEAGGVYRVLRFAGACYLLYVGWRMLTAERRSALAPNATSSTAPTGRSPILAGLLTTLSNPKSAVFWTSVFVVLVPAHAPVWFYGAVVALIVAQSALWYGTVALALSTAFARRHYLRLTGWLDRIAGVVMIGFGLKLANEVRSEFFGR